MMEKYMHRCLELAALGIGNAAPNPMVGSVVVFEDRIIGEGYHRKCGENHAEVNAIESVKDKSLLTKSTIYVNLEPCSHFGKTPPCADLIIKHRIPKVVVGCVDSFSEVAGKGIERLRNAGCEVTVGVLEKECRALNRRFFTFHEKQQPYVILKWAQTIDGYIDAKRNENTPVAPVWITDEKARMLVHKWRSEESAIMVGTNTVAADNPSLTVRDWAGKNPIRIVLDRNLRLDNQNHVFDKTTPTIVLNQLKNEVANYLEYIQIDFDSDFLNSTLKILHQRKIQSVIIEGGAMLINSFVEQNLWDEARVFVGDKFFYAGTKAPAITEKFRLNSQLTVGNSRLYWFGNCSIK